MGKIVSSIVITMYKCGVRWVLVSTAIEKYKKKNIKKEIKWHEPEMKRDGEMMGSWFKRDPVE